MFYKEELLKNFGKLTGKHLCQSFFFYKVVGLQSVLFPTGNSTILSQTAFFKEVLYLRWNERLNQYSEITGIFFQTEERVLRVNDFCYIWQVAFLCETDLVLLKADFL